MTNEELAREVAVKVMKFTGPYPCVVEAFALDWPDAGRVIKKMLETGWHMEVVTHTDPDAVFVVTFSRCGIIRHAHADTFPRAVFLAALKAVEAAK